MFDRIPFRPMPKAFRTFSKFLLALAFFALPNLVPQGVSASSGDTLSGSISPVSNSGVSVSSTGASFSGNTASGKVLTGSLLKPKLPVPHLVQTGLRAEHNLPEEIL